MRKHLGLLFLSMLLLAQPAARASSPKSKASEHDVHPILDRHGFLVGGMVDGRWMSGRSMSSHLLGVEHYRFYAGTECRGTARGGKPDADLGVDTHPGMAGNIAISADWSAIPRVSKRVKPTKQDEANVRLILDENGLNKARVRISGVIVADIKGDGAYWRIISAASMNPSLYTVGDYSLIAMRRDTKGNSQAHLIAGDIHSKNVKTDMPRYYSVDGLYDLDGDKTLEVVAAFVSPALESYGTEIYKIANGQSRLVAAVRPNWDYKLK